MNAALALNRARLIEVESEIQKLEAHLAALHSEKEDICQRLDEYMYPVLTVPNEIITEIFVHYLPPYPDHPPLVGPGSPTFLLGICRLWRSIALHSPALWRSIKAVVHAFILPKTQLEMVKTWLHRSGASPLSLDIHFGAPYATGLLQAVVSHCARWEYVYFMLMKGHFPLICGPAPSLVQMTLITIWNGTPHRPTISLHDTPLLCSAYLCDVACDVRSIPWDQLTSLATGRSSFLESVPILQAASNLRSCKLFLGLQGENDGIHLRMPRVEMLSLDTLMPAKPFWLP
ncbi:hypothetical protein C8F01DRAFT_1360613 [Mycena amicta]|nr:hypothetical protein C8F01DRAFT_1360613 [Mycena amicta]